MKTPVRLFPITFLLITTKHILANPFLGTWNLSEIHDENDTEITLPAPPEGDAFLFELSESSKGSDFVRWNTKIGNVMFAEIELADPMSSTNTTEISISHLMSTMMMPSDKLFRLEQYLTNVFPDMTSMTIFDDINLSFEGAGTIHCVKGDN